MAEPRKRIDWIDMAKGYGIIFVILAHCHMGLLGTWIYTFHMPLFFLLSGYLFNANCDFGTFVKKKSKSMLIPYFCLGIPMMLFTEITLYFKGDFTVSGCINMIFDFIVQRRMGTLWYLACLFFLNILFYFTLKVLKTDKKLACFAVVSTVLGVLYNKFVGVELPWNIEVCFTAYPFFFVGYFYKEKHEIIDKYFDNKKLSIIVLAVFGLVNVSFGLLSYKFGGSVLDMFNSHYGCAPFTYISAFAGIVCVIVISKWFTFRPIQYIGKNSLLYFAWHQIIMIPVSEWILSLAHMTIDSASIILFVAVYRALQLLIILGLLTLCNMIISKTKLKFILGK